MAWRQSVSKNMASRQTVEYFLTRHKYREPVVHTFPPFNFDSLHFRLHLINLIQLVDYDFLFFYFSIWSDGGSFDIIRQLKILFAFVVDIRRFLRRVWRPNFFILFFCIVVPSSSSLTRFWERSLEVRKNLRNTTRGRKSHPSKLQVSSSHRIMKRPASEVLYAYTLLQQPLAIMDVMQVCNLRLFLLFFLGWRKPLLWFMIFQGKKMILGEIWVFARVGRMRLEVEVNLRGGCVGKQRHPLCFCLACEILSY